MTKPTTRVRLPKKLFDFLPYTPENRSEILSMFFSTAARALEEEGEDKEMFNDLLTNLTFGVNTTGNDIVSNGAMVLFPIQRIERLLALTPSEAINELKGFIVEAVNISARKAGANLKGRTTVVEIDDAQAMAAAGYGNGKQDIETCQSMRNQQIHAAVKHGFTFAGLDTTAVPITPTASDTLNNLVTGKTQDSFWELVDKIPAAVSAVEESAPLIANYRIIVAFMRLNSTLAARVSEEQLDTSFKRLQLAVAKRLAETLTYKSSIAAMVDGLSYGDLPNLPSLQWYQEKYQRSERARATGSIESCFVDEIVLKAVGRDSSQDVKDACVDVLENWCAIIPDKPDKTILHVLAEYSPYILEQLVQKGIVTLVDHSAGGALTAEDIRTQQRILNPHATWCCNKGDGGKKNLFDVLKLPFDQPFEQQAASALLSSISPPARKTKASP